MKKYVLFFIFMIYATAAPAAVRAETLDDASIHKLYDQIDAALNDQQETANILKERAADTFTTTSDLTYHAHGKVTQKSETRNKSQILSDIAHPRETDIKDYHHEIMSITYSDDKKFAYVKDTVTMTLVTKKPASGQDKPNTFTEKMSGTQTLSLIDGTIKALKNVRQIDLTLNEQ